MTGNDSYRNSIDDKLTTATTETQKLSQRLDVNDGKLTVATTETQKLNYLLEKATNKIDVVSGIEHMHGNEIDDITNRVKLIYAKIVDHDEAFRLNNILLGLTMIIAIVGLFT